MGFFDKLFSKREKKATEERTLMTMEVGDIVSYFGIDYEIFAVIDWMEEEFSWKEYKLKNRRESYWISVEVDNGEVIAGFYEVLKNFPLDNPPPKKIKYKDKTYLLKEKGKAVGTLTSQASKQNYQCLYELQCLHYDYESEDGKSFFSVEDFGGEMEVSAGEPLKSSEVNILPCLKKFSLKFYAEE